MNNFLDILPIRGEEQIEESVVTIDGQQVLVRTNSRTGEMQVIDVVGPEKEPEESPVSTESIAAGALAVIVLLAATIMLMRKTTSD